MDRDCHSPFTETPPGLDRRRFGVTLAAGLCTALTGGCGLGRDSFRFCMKLAATMNGVRYSSATVIQAKVVAEPFEFGDSGDGLLALRGDAVAIDLPGNRTLFGLRDQQLALRVAWLCNPDQGRARDVVPAFDSIGADFRVGTTRTLEGNLLPELAMIDAGDPKTLRRITPAALARLGIAPVTAVVTITDESPAPHDLMRRYQWFEALDRRLRNHDRSLPPPGILADSLV